MSKVSRRLVVDASVMRSAGAVDRPGHSGACAKALQQIERMEHRVVITPDVQRE